MYDAKGEQRNKTALAPSSGEPGRPSGISAAAFTDGLSPAAGAAAPRPGMPSAIFLPSTSIDAPSPLSCVRRVVIQPKLTTLARTPKAPHS